MGDALAAFPDAEVVITTLLEAVAPTGTVTPDTLDGDFIRVQRIGGSDDGITDYPRMEITCYGTDRQRAWQLAEQARQVILASVRTDVDGVLIDSAATDNPPTQVPNANPDVRRVIGYYRFAWRRGNVNR